MTTKSHLDPKTNIEWFKHFLYRDPDFLALSQQFSSWFEIEVSEDTRTVIQLTSTKDNSLKAQLDEQCGHCDGTNIIETAARKFEVPEHIIEYGFIKRPELRGVSDERRPQVLTSQNETVTIRHDELVIKIRPNTRFEDIEEIWPLVNSMQKKFTGYTPKLDTTQQYALIYAIYKLRLSDKNGKRSTFYNIFRKYQDGGLPGYKGSTTQIKSADSLSAKYRQFIPKPNEM